MKLYVVTRADLAPGVQCAQACHAVRLFAEEHPAIDRDWYRSSNNLVVLAVPDEGGLHRLAELARRQHLALSCFYEPDLGDTLTALALEPAGTLVVGSLPLALRRA